MRIFTPIQIAFFTISLVFVGVLEAQNSTVSTILDGHQQRHHIIPASMQFSVAFQDLIPNQTYTLMAPADEDLGICVPDISTSDTSAQVLAYDSVLHQIKFIAHAKSLVFTLSYACNWNPENPPGHYLSLICQTCAKKKLKELVQEMETISVSGGQSAEDLVKEVLIGGNCFDVTNVEFQGQGGQIGTFSNGLTNVGFATGMVMATGDVSVVVGPNDSDSASAGYGVSTPDGDLGTLTNGNIFDRASVEFDFSPTQTPLTFDFVFGSEEYCEYVNSQFNDVFGFFISGPGIAGTQNLAVLPGGTPVAINSVNHLVNTGFYINNTGPSGQLCGQNASFLPSVNELQFDGYTRKLTAVANVIPCQTYHIKLKIGDVGDGVFDSGVFLKSGSFDAGGNASVDFVVNGDPDATEVYEGCGTVQIVFDRIGGNLSTPLVVPYTISGTAKNGIDYTGIPGVAVIPAGQDKLTLTVNITNDLLIEGDETIIITLNNPCSCSMPQEILIIKDLPTLTAVPDTTVICGPGVGVVGVTPLTGVPPFTYQWSTGSNEQTISPYASVSSNYKVTVTDGCGKTIVQTARIIVRTPPVGQLQPPAPQLCPGQEGTIKVKFTGTGPFILEYLLNGDPQPPIENITENPFSFTINQPGLYTIAAVYDSLGCKGTGQGALLVINSSLSMTGTTVGASCFGQNNGSINTSVVSGQGPYNYTWSGPSNIGNVADPVNILGGVYTATVTDFFGCQATQTFTVPTPTAISPVISAITGPNCSNPQGGAIDLSVSGGTPGYTYKWSTGAVTQDLQNLAVGTYTVTITDAGGCIKTTTATVVGNFTPPIADAAANGGISCSKPTLVLDGTNSSSGAGISYNWSANPGTIVSGGTTTTPTISAAGTYTIVVTNSANGCTASDQVVVAADVVPPIANAGPDQTFTCVINNITLDGSGSSSGPNFTYLWTSSGSGAISAGATTLNPIVSTAGTYTLVVTNTSNGCTKSDNVTVNSNLTPPTAIIANPGILTCQNTSLTLNGSASTPTGGISFQWSTNNGLILSGQTTANAVIGEPGDYTLTVTNNVNGCTHTKTVTVAQDNSVPIANASVNALLTCATKQLTLSGLGSSTGANFTFIWSASAGGNFVSGKNTLNPIVDAPANYTLLVTNTINNCTATASVLVGQDNQAPPASAGAPATLTCTLTQVMLGDTNALVAPNLSYSWTGSGITGGGNTPTPTVNKPGLYTLLVTNSTNGCTSTATVNINQNITNPSAVVAPGGQLNCTTPAVQLNGAGSSTGANFNYNWTSSTGGGIGAGANTLTPTVTAAGTYTLLVTNSTNGCTSSASATVTSNANLPIAIAAPSGILTCAVQQVTLNGTGSTTGGTMAYQWGTINGQITGGQGTLMATVNKPGQYTLIVTNTANNCTATYNLLVTADIAAPQADAGADQVLDCTKPYLTLNGSGSSTGANYTYNWTAQSGSGFVSGTNIQSVEVNQPGTYQLQVTNTQNGCTAIDEVSILADANDPVVSIANPAILNCITPQVNLNAMGSSTGANFTYAWSGIGLLNGGTGLNEAANAPGVYTLLITNTANGCTSSASITVNQDIAKPISDAGLDNILNCSNPQLQLGGAGNPSGASYSFQWAGPGILSGGNTANPVANQGGTYTLTVTNIANGCTSTDAVNLNTDFAQPQANAGPAFQLTCVNNSYVLGASASTGPNFTYSWTTNTGNFLTASNILNPTVNGAGTYFLLVSDTNNGCTQTASVQITQAADVPVAVALDAPDLTCTVNSLVLSGTGSSVGAEFSYTWTATQGGNILSGENTLAPTINAPGLYTLSVKNNTNNCVSNSSVLVSQNIAKPNLNAGASPTLTCANPSVQLTGSIGSNGNFTFDWSANPGNIVSGKNTLNPTVDAAGVYSLTATSAQNGCTNSATVVVNVDKTAPNAVIANPATLTCTVTQLALDATASSNGNMAYSWSTANGNLLNQSTPLAPVVDKPGTYTLLVKNNDNGCTQTASVTVPQDVQLPVAQAGADGLLTCTVTSLQLNGQGSSQNGNYFYQWDTNNGQILVGANGLTPTIVAGGTYTLFVRNNTNGCTATDAVLVNVNTQAPLVAIASPEIITCTKPEITLDGSNSDKGPGIVFSWSTQDGNIVSGNTQNKAQVNASGTYLLTVLNNNNGCSSTANAVVSDNILLPVANAGNAFTLTCSINSVILQGSGSNGSIYTYSWSSSAGQPITASNTLNPSVNQPGIYTLTVLNTTTGCKKSDEVEVFRETNVPTAFDFKLDKPGCKDNDGVITFGAVKGGYGPYMYSIDNGKTFVSDLDFNGIVPGSYDLWIQDINGCEFHQPLLVPKAPDPAITLPAEISIVLGDSLHIQSVLPAGYALSLIDTIIWTPNDGLYFKDNTILSLLNPGAKPFKPTEYKVTLISTDGCEASDRILIRVDNEPRVYIPNIFTPDAEDSNNNLVYIFSDDAQVVRVNSFQIYDRWGTLVYRAQNFLPNDPAQGWDGTVDGKKLDPAVFVYYADILLIDGRRLLFKGDVTLMR